ncbi:hypothetical protein [Thiothrix subterranea]|uniref:Uncharacterized protein n=1 Tax=Thiothrix subterranea TaxID=2735563 RepID=A0AA51MMQ1_9GAMM|nr:hypothetical protein [Thiothrix subterranea]WML85871.1 hypothetical protein RCG00_16395 [Thiothrix subterranea]
MNDTRIYQYNQLQRELMSSILQVAMTDDLLQNPTILPDKAGESYRVVQHLETVHRLLTAIKEGRAMRDDGSANTNLYSSYR